MARVPPQAITRMAEVPEDGFAEVAYRLAARNRGHLRLGISIATTLMIEN